MSGRRRPIWDDKEDKRSSAEIHSNVSPGRSQNWSKSEVHGDLMHGNSSRSPSWDHLQGNNNRPKDDDIRRDRNRMNSHPTFDEWGKQYSTHPSYDSYDLPYRSWDKGVGGNMRMNRERERERTRSPNGSRSRSGDSRSSREGTRDRRHEINASYPDMRNNSKDYASRGGGNNITESWSRRTDYKEGPRYNDYPHRNVQDDYRNNRIPCKYFAAGNCYRDNCKFSHDVSEAAAAGGYDDKRSLGNKNRTRPYDHQPHDDLNAKSNFGGFDETSSQGHTSDDNNNNTKWDDKKMWLDGHASRVANPPALPNSSWDDVSGSGFSSVLSLNHKYEKSAKESLNAQGRMSAKSGSNNTKKWDGPLWDEHIEPETDNSKIGKWDGPGMNKMASDNIVLEDANQQIPASVKEMHTQSLSYLNGSEQSHILLSNTFNGQVQGMYVHMENQNKGDGKPLEVDVPQPQTMNDTSLTSQLAPQANAPPHHGQFSQSYSESTLTNAIESLPNSAYNQDTRAKEEFKISVHESSKLGIMEKEAVDKGVAENSKKEVENKNPEAKGNVEEGDIGNDEKAMRQFKIGLVDFVKEILKPKWKEGKMSREVHKNVVKKVVEKVTSTIQRSQIPRTQPKIDQYLAYSKPKITKLVEAYTERLLKA